MPSRRPCAAFEPISPDFNVRTLVEATPNFEYVVRIQADMIDHQGLEAFEKLVLVHVILGGKPLVVEGYDRRLDRWSFAVQWLRDNVGSKVENPRDLTKKTNVPMTFSHYLNHMALLTNQWTPLNYKDPERQRIYLKDIDCPALWHDKLQAVLPDFLYYLNDTSGEPGGFGAVDEPDPNGSGMRRGRGIAKAGDLMSCLPKEMRAENMMCYIGHEGTYTPAHREMCASLGQNIMVEASTGMIEDGKPTKPGSSIWFMTESKERSVVSEYWLSRLGHDIEVENHFAQVNAWKNAPFKTYVVEQKPGDFILIPPLAPHQVWNRGTRTMKVAWNRTTVETLEMALDEALPRARIVCRDEQYKNKAIIYFALQRYSTLLKSAAKVRQKQQKSKDKHEDNKVRQLQKDFRRLHGLYSRLLVSESFLPQQQEKPELVPFEGYITCSYCRCNIFNRFLTCPSCVKDNGEDTYDICMDCYAMGRSCACISKLNWVEQFPWSQLTVHYDQWRQQILACEGKVTEKSPMTLKIELERLGRKRTLAQICQLELKRRPWRDITKPLPAVDGVEREEEVEVDANGITKKKKKVRRSEKYVREHGRCHTDYYWEPKWKQAHCSHCEKNYCYGVLFRAYDMMPQDILADPDWKCPSCRNCCSCRVCKKLPNYEAYTPSTTMLGHNTKAIADPRSVESLVDFSSSNIGWIQKAGDDSEDNTRRLAKRRQEAEAAKAQDPQLGEDYIDTEKENDGVEAGILRLAEHEGIPIDPALETMGTPQTDTFEDENQYNEYPEGQGDISSERGPMEPQYVVPVPAGGIIRDREHVYDATEAITYDYPDPDMGAPPVIEDADAAPTGYGAAVPDSPGKIEMVSKKRKRNKLDEGEKAFGYYNKKDTAKPVESSNKRRQSLIVKLPVNKEKLAELNKMKILAQRALNGVADAPAPVIGSDLQALNTGPVSEGQPVPNKKARLEPEFKDRDDEFMPGRYHDRRKKLAEITAGAIPHPDADITRRQTRNLAATYEELDDENEFDDVVEKPRLGSKLATMEQAAEEDTDMIDEDGEFDIDGALIAERPSPQDPSASDDPPERASEVRPTPSTARSTTTAPAAPHPSIGKTTPSTIPKSSATNTRPSTASSTLSKVPAGPSKAQVATAAANRKAKMAALSYLDDSEDSLDGDSWSEGDEPEAAEPVGKASVSARLVVDAAGNAIVQTQKVVGVQHVHRPAAAAAAAAVSSGGGGIGKSLLSSNMPSSTTTMKSTPVVGKQQQQQQRPSSLGNGKVSAPQQQPQPQQQPTVVKAFSAKKVSIADWDDSGSSDEDGSGSSGWAAVNESNKKVKRRVVAGLKPVTSAKRGGKLGL